MCFKTESWSTYPAPRPYDTSLWSPATTSIRMLHGREIGYGSTYILVNPAPSGFGRVAVRVGARTAVIFLESTQARRGRSHEYVQHEYNILSVPGIGSCHITMGFEFRMPACWVHCSLRREPLGGKMSQILGAVYRVDACLVPGACMHIPLQVRLCQTLAMTGMYASYTSVVRV